MAGVMRLSVLLFPVAATVVTGCGNTAEPGRFVITTQTVTARQLVPNATFVVDTSAGVAPRFVELRQALENVLQRHPTTANYGLAAFPGDAACGAAPLLLKPEGPADDDEAKITARTLAVVDALQRLTAAGGSPSIAATLTGLELPDDVHRQDFVVLLTASEPACGGDALEAVKALRRKDVKTVVVGFGADAATSAPLDALARAGGFQRTCPSMTAAECGAGDVCNAGVCGRAAWLASSGADLEGVFDQLLTPLSSSYDACAFTLTTRPRSLDRLRVYVDGQRLEPETGFTFSVDRVDVLGEPCRLLQRSTVLRPVEVQLWVDVSP